MRACCADYRRLHTKLEKCGKRGRDAGSGVVNYTLGCACGGDSVGVFGFEDGRKGEYAWEWIDREAVSRTAGRTGNEVDVDDC